MGDRGFSIDVVVAGDAAAGDSRLPRNAVDAVASVAARATQLEEQFMNGDSGNCVQDEGGNASLRLVRLESRVETLVNDVEIMRQQNRAGQLASLEGGSPVHGNRSQSPNNEASMAALQSAIRQLASDLRTVREGDLQQLGTDV